jgi:hypothetical protein
LRDSGLSALKTTLGGGAGTFEWRFRLMRRQHSGACEASIPDHERPRFRRM